LGLEGREAGLRAGASLRGALGRAGARAVEGAALARRVAGALEAAALVGRGRADVVARAAVVGIPVELDARAVAGAVARATVAALQARRRTAGAACRPARPCCRRRR